MTRLLSVAALWLAANLAWLHTDRLLRDGDEEGHVGAAELMLELIHTEGPLSFVAAAIAGDYGEYPPLYPALVAAWWWLMGSGQPGSFEVRAVGLLWPLISATAIATIAPRGRRLLPFTLVLLAPGLCGLSRHFMPEGALTAAICLAAAAAWRAHRRPDTASALLLGAACGAALLIKQTAILYLLAPALLALYALRTRSLLSAAVVFAVAGPWYVSQLDAQRQYVARSVDAGGWGWGWEALAYYPVVGSWSELGPLLTILFLLGVAWGWRSDTVRFGLAWGGLSLLLLTMTPRKYPRLLAPLLPAAALIAGVGVRRERVGWVLAAGAAGWVTATSTLWMLPEPPLIAGVDDGCLQRWLRPPVGDDFGFSVVADAVREAGVSEVVVFGGLEVPCVVQTTHAWIDHLPPYLRRAGLDVTVAEGERGPLVVAWGVDEPEVVVPALGGGFSIYTDRGD